jgi:hypothetical protein
MQAMLVLEVGCGAGSFSELLLATVTEAVKLYMSNSVDANHATNDDHGNCPLFRGDTRKIPFLDRYVE